jgi:hypothetical protein
MLISLVKSMILRRHYISSPVFMEWSYPTSPTLFDNPQDHCYINHQFIKVAYTDQKKIHTFNKSN